MAAKAAGARHIVGVDPFAARREVGVRLGATLALEPSADLVDLVRDLTGGAGISHALDTTGNSGAIAQAFDSLGNLGQLVLVGLGMSDLPQDAAALMSGGRTIRGCIEGDARPHEFIPMLAQMYADGELPLDLIVRHYPFEAINDAVRDMQTGETIKPVLLFS
jgi:aryl-alcohol dehydrogenase